MRYRTLAKRLKKLGCRELRSAKGSHRILKVLQMSENALAI